MAQLTCEVLSEPGAEAFDVGAQAVDDLVGHGRSRGAMRRADSARSGERIDPKRFVQRGLLSERA